MRRILLGLALSAGLGVGIAPAALAGAAAPAPPWGVVDMDRVSGEYKGMQILDQQFQEFRKQQEAELDRRQKNRLLFDDEQRQYLDLSGATAAPTPERDQRLAELEKLSDERSRRLLDLGKKKDRTPDEEQEYHKLDQVYAQRSQEITAIQADTQKAVMAKYEELSKVISDSVNGAVKSVAQEKKLPIVLRKEIVLWGGVDITDEVVTRLNQGPLPQASITPVLARPAPALARPAPAETPKPASAAAGESK